MTTLFELHEIVKQYRGRCALDQVSFQVQPGVVGLLGPNGAGKTTLIKILLGVIQATSGTGSVMGRPLGSRLGRANIGFMPEDDCFIPGISGVEMVQMVARLSGLPSLEALRRAHEILDFAGMEQERYRAVETYSTGMRQKLKFAQAIVHDPHLLILDEPTASLDPAERRGMLSRIDLLAKQHGKSLLLSTHILPDVQQVCDQIIILARGRVRLEGRLSELDRRHGYLYRLAVLDDPARLFDGLRSDGWDCRIEPDGAVLVNGKGPADVPKFFRVALRVGSALRSATPIRQSLDEMFLAAVQESEDAVA